MMFEPPLVAGAVQVTPMPWLTPMAFMMVGLPGGLILGTCAYAGAAFAGTVAAAVPASRRLSAATGAATTTRRRLTFVNLGMPRPTARKRRRPSLGSPLMVLPLSRLITALTRSDSTSPVAARAHEALL